MEKSPSDVASALALTREEALALIILQYRMLERDIAGSAREQNSSHKRAVRNEFRKSAEKAIREQSEDQGAAPLDLWADEFIAEAAARNGRVGPRQFDEAYSSAVESMTRRSRALLLLIELYAFDPWGTRGKWVNKVRLAALQEITRDAPALREEDLMSVVREYKAALKALRRETTSRGKVVLLAGGGLALGVVTGGLAAPVIGAAVGSALGLSGAAATSAGLALLGGGSVVSGGLGMAGGTALVSGLAGVAGAGTLAAGGKLTGWTAGQVVADALKLNVVTRLVLIDAEGDDEKARKVVEGLNERVVSINIQLVEIAEQMQRQRDEIKRLKKEGRSKEERIRALQEQLREAEDRHASIKLAQSALEVSSDRISKSL